MPDDASTFDFFVASSPSPFAKGSMRQKFKPSNGDFRGRKQNKEPNKKGFEFEGERK